MKALLALRMRILSSTNHRRLGSLDLQLIHFSCNTSLSQFALSHCFEFLIVIWIEKYFDNENLLPTSILHFLHDFFHVVCNNLAVGKGVVGPDSPVDHELREHPFHLLEWEGLMFLGVGQDLEQEVGDVLLESTDVILGFDEAGDRIIVAPIARLEQEEFYHESGYYGWWG